MPALALLVLATLFWAGNYVVGEQVVETVGPLSLTWWRWVLSAVPLLGLLGVVAYPLFLYSALEHTTASSAAIINATNPAVIVVAAVLIGQATATWRSWAGMALGLAGVLLVLTGGDVGRLLALRFNTGDLIMLLAVVAWTAYTLLGRRVGVPPLTSTAAQVVLSVLVLTPFTLAAGLDVPTDPPGWTAVIYIVLGPSIGSYVCWNLAVSRISPTVAGVSMNLVTVFTLVIAALLGQPPTLVQAVGGALVIGGVLLASVTSRSRPRGRPPG